MKRIMNITLTILLLAFSFYYTNKVSNYLKNKDPIMIKIKSLEAKYNKNYLNATISNNTIIPGLSGSVIDINNSYLKMKKIKSFQENSLILKEIEPVISIKNNQDKYIISGNPNKKNIAILIKTNNLDILKYYENTNINLIVTNTLLNNNYNYFKNINNNLVVYQAYLKKNYNLIDYCYETSLENINICSNYNKYTIVPTIINHDYYYSTYQELKNGQIFLYNILNDNNIKELNVLVKGLSNLGYKIVSLDELIKE